VTSVSTAAASLIDNASGPVTSSACPSRDGESSSRTAAPTSARSSRDTKLVRPSPAGAAITARPSATVAKNGTKSAYMLCRRNVARTPVPAMCASVAACWRTRVKTASGLALRNDV
jgi:hypothetical protein